MSKEKNIEAIKIIRLAELKQQQQVDFCRKYKMDLQALLHVEMEKELGRIARRLEDILETGYVKVD